MRKILCLALLWPAGVLGGASPVIAQTPIPTYEDEVVVTATAVEEDEDDLPAAVTVIRGEEIAARQSTSVAEVIATTPGVIAATAGPPGQQTSVFVRGAESDQTLLLWNGIELNSFYFGGANWQFLPTDGIERVEVVRGPFSALYGGNAVGGVVQVFTGAVDGAALHLEGGEDAYRRGSLVAGHDFGPARLDLTASQRRGDSELVNGDFDSRDVVARLRWAVAPGLTVGLLARSNDSETGIPSSGGVPSPERRIDWREREVAVPLAAEVGPWKVAAQLSQVEFTSSFRDPEDPFGFTRGDTDSQARRGRVVASRRRGEASWVAFGAEVEEVEVSDRSSFGVNLEAAEQDTWAVFAETGFTAGPFSVDLGVRRDESDPYGGSTSLRAGTSLALGEATRLRASYGEAFRPPTLGELYFPFSGNPQLEPERGASFELGASHRRGAWQLELALFQLEQESVIEFDNARFTFANIGRARSRGVEGAVSYAADRWEVRANATLLEAVNLDTGRDLLRRPRESASVVVTVRPGAWSLNATGRWVGERDDFDPATGATVVNPGYLRLDLAARWQATRRLAPYARVENAADREYDEVLGFPAPGRTVVGGLAVGF